jgi:hypothetical protein
MLWRCVADSAAQETELVSRNKWPRVRIRGNLGSGSRRRPINRLSAASARMASRMGMRWAAGCLTSTSVCGCAVREPHRLGPLNACPPTISVQSFRLQHITSWIPPPFPRQDKRARPQRSKAEESTIGLGLHFLLCGLLFIMSAKNSV